ncbi:MAG TPA: alpha/beta fold hydrolase, partial [Bacteroidota bacterium]|nr:alpha/beta fold hydrolase [Bacteroidota bacterium]
MNEYTVLRSNFRLANGIGNNIHGEVRFCASSVQKPAIIICHSFMAFKDWGFFPYVAEMLARAGFVAVTFNFSLNGVVRHSNRITDFSSFEKNNFSQELEDLNVVIDAMVNRNVSNGLIDPERIVLLGHSRGGGIAIVKTSTDHRVKCLVTWSAIATFDRWTEHQRAQ